MRGWEDEKGSEGGWVVEEEDNNKVGDKKKDEAKTSVPITVAFPRLGSSGCDRKAQTLCLVGKLAILDYWTLVIKNVTDIQSLLGSSNEVMSGEGRRQNQETRLKTARERPAISEGAGPLCTWVTSVSEVTIMLTAHWDTARVRTKSLLENCFLPSLSNHHLNSRRVGPYICPVAVVTTRQTQHGGTFTHWGNGTVSPPGLIFMCNLLAILDTLNKQRERQTEKQSDFKL